MSILHRDDHERPLIYDEPCHVRAHDTDDRPSLADLADAELAHDELLGDLLRGPLTPEGW